MQTSNVNGRNVPDMGELDNVQGSVDRLIELKERYVCFICEKEDDFKQITNKITGNNCFSFL